MKIRGRISGMSFDETLSILVPKQGQIFIINELIEKSKRHWNYPEEYVKAAIEILRITDTYLKQNICRIVLDPNNQIVGFFAIETHQDAILLLDHLWIDPRKIKCGIGRYCIEKIFEICRNLSFNKLRVLPDPPAEGFYERMGFIFSGKEIPSRVHGGPTFKEYLWS